MGVKDIVTKDYIKDPIVYADAFNHFIYKGVPVIDPQKLRPLDTTEIAVPYGASDAGMPVQKTRDGLQCLAAMEDGAKAYLLLGLENQSEVHYAMPVRDMVMDALQYARQVEMAAKAHRKVKHKEVSSGEYLSGFHKDDRLTPVITLVLCFFPEKWSGPTSLHEMFSVQDENLLSLVPDYKLNLISPANMSDAEINWFQSSLREVMLFIKYSNDKEKLRELVAVDKHFKSIDKKAAKVINTVTRSKLKFKEDKEAMEVSMCLAIDEMRKEERSEGRLEGRTQTLIELVCKKIRKGKSLDTIADETEEELSVITPIYQAALSNAPDYDCEKIFAQLKKTN